ncbi:hypothetical protein THICB2_880020 [Thiomonas sp. CB2]|nr:hypothetical protein THICB2_880020 [Thiomonas sp. CB2]
MPPLRGEKTRYALETPKLRVLPAMTPRAAMLAKIQGGFAKCDVARQARFLGGLIGHGESNSLRHNLFAAPGPFWCILRGFLEVSPSPGVRADLGPGHNASLSITAVPPVQPHTS